MPEIEPFKRGAFDALPETPHRPHGYFATRAETVTVTTPGLGTTRVHVRVHGAGPPLLLVHGLMTSSYSWRYVLEPLGRHFTLYMPDLPGNGASDAPIGADYGPDALATWLGAVIDALGIRGCAAVGNSMGGYLSMRLALRDPTAVSRLVNVHSPGVPEARIYALQAVLAVPGSRALLRWMVRRNTERWVHKNVHYWDESLKSREEARVYGAPLATEGGVRAFTEHLRTTMAPGPMRAFLAELKARKASGAGFPVPLQLVYAKRDPMVPPRFGNVLAEHLPGVPLVWLDEASHFPHVDAPERFVDAVLPFLAARA